MNEQMPLILDQIRERRLNIDICKRRENEREKKEKEQNREKQIHMEQVLSDRSLCYARLLARSSSSRFNQANFFVIKIRMFI